MREITFAHAFLEKGFCNNVCITITEDGTISSVKPDSPGPSIAGIALPGLANLHGHAFQRGMAGLAERHSSGDSDDFWGWREIMYRFVNKLNPEDVEAIAAQAYVEMLESGFTSIGEFHYLHHGSQGQPYDDLGEMAGRIASAASTTGIGLTLLPALYSQGGINDTSIKPNQRRFANDLDQFQKLVERSQTLIATLEDAHIGIAPHSLRAVTPQNLEKLSQLYLSAPIHIHVAEQPAEVESCLSTYGARPVDWLLDNIAIDERWCLIHATHMTNQECQKLARSGATVGLCPITEANLGDGIFPARDYLASGGIFGVGSDSHIRIDASEELRLLDYGQRLCHCMRNPLALSHSTSGRRLFEAAALGGARALGRHIGLLAPHHRADIVVLDAHHPTLIGKQGDAWLDSWIFSGGSRVIRDVFIGGKPWVVDGRHIASHQVRDRFSRTIRRLID